MKVFPTLLITLLFSTGILAQSNNYCSTDGIAIKGYDPVAYFLQSKAVKGGDSYFFNWSGTKWKFISQANLDSFKLAPTRYAPQYGGYCAFGCSENHKVAADPLAWTVVNNKLYLNYSLKVKEYWITDTANRIKAASGFWPALNN